jgi:hypothetical protein
LYMLSWFSRYTTVYWMSEWVINSGWCQMSIFSGWQDGNNINFIRWWIPANPCFVLSQHTELDLKIAVSIKQQFAVWTQTHYTNSKPINMLSLLLYAASSYTEKLQIQYEWRARRWQLHLWGGDDKHASDH